MGHSRQEATAIFQRLLKTRPLGGLGDILILISKAHICKGSLPLLKNHTAPFLNFLETEAHDVLQFGVISHLCCCLTCCPDLAVVLLLLFVISSPSSFHTWHQIVGPYTSVASIMSLLWYPVYTSILTLQQKHSL